MKNILTQIGLFIFLIMQTSMIFAQSSTLSTNIQTNSGNQNQFNSEFLYKDIYAYFRPNYKPMKYSKFSYQTDAPMRANMIFKYLFNKAGFKCVDYYDLFPYGKTYSIDTINQIITLNKIDGFVTIGFQRDKYDRGTEFSGIAIENIAVGTSEAVTGSSVVLYIDFYNNETVNEPFIRVIGKAKGGDGADVALCEKIFWITLKELLNKKLILK